MLILVGDVGGTNARLATIEIADGRRAIVAEHWYPSADFPSLAAVAHRFLHDTGAQPERACFAVACPIVEGKCTAPNLPWTIDARALAVELGIAPLSVVNDFYAVGRAVPHLAGEELVTLQEGTAATHGPIAVIGAGTGLGQAFLLWIDGRYRVFPSEGGHASFAPRSARERALLEFLQARFPHVSVERVLSGRGLASIYEFLVASEPERERAATRAAIDAEQDDAAVVTRCALSGEDPLCVEALDIFCAVYGATAANLALTVVATGGVYLAGGIAPRIIAHLQAGIFVKAFRDKGRMGDLLSRIPVRVMVEPRVGLIGAAAVAVEG